MNTTQTNPAAATRATTPEASRDNRGSDLWQDVGRGSTIAVGMVMSANPNGVGFLVRIPGMRQLTACTMAAPVNGYGSGFGHNMTVVPPAGTSVAVLLGQLGETPRGIILCTVPLAFYGGLGEGGVRRMSLTQCDCEPGAGVTTESSYNVLVDNTQVADTPMLSGGFPVDMAAGTMDLANPFGVQQRASLLAADWGAGELARIQAFAVDGLLRLISQQYQHWGPLGDRHFFTDGGYGSEEDRGSPHWCERLGNLKYGQPWLQEAQPTFDTLQKACKLPTPETRMERARYYRVQGFLASMRAAWYMQPDPDVPVVTSYARPKDRGVWGEHVDSSGRWITSTAGGVFIERTDRIPVPHRLRQPQDPSGDKVENSPDMHKTKDPFVLDPENPEYTALWLEDYLAWEKRLWYQRFSELNKDFYVPEENEVKVAEDQIEDPGPLLAKLDHSKHEDKRGIFFLTKDGGVGLRDTEGGELVLSGGKLRITAPNGIEGFSGQDLVLLAGRDCVVKGRGSVDITATEADVRIKGENNVQLVSEGAVLVESRATTDALAYKDREGTDMRGGGVQIVARDSRVFVHGRMAHVAGTEVVAIESQDGAGSILLSARRILGFGQQVILATPRGAALTLAAGAATLSGRSVNLLAQSGLALIRNNRAWVPFMELPIDSDIYSAYSEHIRPLIEAYYESTDWMGEGYTPEARTEIRFKYRNSEQYGTTGKFKWVEPYWAWLRRKFGRPLDKWAERKMDERAPWPGTGPLDAGDALHRLKKENNIQPGDRLPVKRSERKPEGGEIEKVSFQELPVVPNT